MPPLAPLGYAYLWLSGFALSSDTPLFISHIWALNSQVSFILLAYLLKEIC